MFLKLKITFITFTIFVLPVKSQNQSEKNEHKKFPHPSGIKNMLFYIQRTLNTNTIIYELNTNQNGTINVKEPIKFYYINYANHGEVEEVSSIQKKYAYGIVIKLINKEQLYYSFSFNSIKDREFYLMESAKDKKFHVFCHINKQLATLNNVFVTMEPNVIGWPRVRKIELFGTSITKDENVMESFTP